MHRHARGRILDTLWLCVGLASLASVGCTKADSFAAEVPLTVEALVPPDVPVLAQHAALFELDGRELRFTHVEYGQVLDCEAGCFASHVCAIEDGSDVQLYFATWTIADPRPLGLDTSCASPPDFWGAPGGTLGCHPEGKRHALAVDPTFLDFARGQVGTGAEFGICFSFYTQCLDTPC